MNLCLPANTLNHLETEKANVEPDKSFYKAAPDAEETVKEVGLACVVNTATSGVVILPTGTEHDKTEVGTC